MLVGPNLHLPLVLSWWVKTSGVYVEVPQACHMGATAKMVLGTCKRFFSRIRPPAVMVAVVAIESSS